MAQGGRKIPPNNRSPVVMHSRSDPTVIPDPTTMSKSTPDIPIEPMTLIPQGIDVQ